LNIQLICCRYWWLTHWEFRELSFPYWRVYWNGKAGASINFNGTTHALTPGRIILIAPNTSYSSKILGNEIPPDGYSFSGGRIHNCAPVSPEPPQNAIPHFFIHFKLGIPYDHIEPGIHILELTPHWQQKLDVITAYLRINYTQFDFYTVLAIHSLISDLLSKIPEKHWESPTNDGRLLKVLGYIETHLEQDLSNQTLAEVASLAVNSFTRLFTQEVHTPPQKFVKKKRIDFACVRLQHADHTIDKIANDAGFADRYHFSKIFKQHTGFSPAKYRKEFGIR
jgi:AraC-like DNA-binding protein